MYKIFRYYGHYFFHKPYFTLRGKFLVLHIEINKLLYEDIRQLFALK
jgi:hypothetical protein